MIRAILLAAGLLTGPVHVGVDLVAEPAVAPDSVEMILDGETVALLHAPPWEARIDLGAKLKPRKLAVVSRDSAGAEIDREIRWLNLHVSAEARTRNATPIPVFLDGEYSEKGTEPTPDELANQLEVAGRKAEVIEVSRPDAELWIVRDPNAQPELDRSAALAVGGILDDVTLNGEIMRTGMAASRKVLSANEAFFQSRWSGFRDTWDDYLRLFHFEQGTQLRLVSPWGAPVSQIEQPRHVLGTTQPLAADQQGLLFHVYATRPLTRWFRLADAVGLAGLESTRRVRRRAVLLLTAEPDMPDESLYDAEQVRGYLADLGVPLFVWSLSHETTDAVARWGGERPVAPTAKPTQSIGDEPAGGRLRDFEAAFLELSEALQHQRIVWIRGRHLPADVALSEAARGIRLVPTPGEVAR